MAKRIMHKYRLKGKVFLTQYCHVRYPAKTELSTVEICQALEDCEGHEIIVVHEEICEGESPDDAIGNWSLSKYEGMGKVYGAGDGLEPTWCGDPEWTLVEE